MQWASLTHGALTERLVCNVVSKGLGKPSPFLINPEWFKPQEF